MFISVIMAAYNAEKHVEEAVESVLAQTHRDFEFVVVDDGSSDRTREILKEYERRDQRLRVITQENQGAGAARNAAILAIRSDWFAVMDSDDVMEPERLERQISFVKEHPDLAIASSLVVWIDDDGNELGRSHSDLTTDAAVRNAYEQDPVLVFSHPGCLIRRELVLELGGYRTEFWPCEDLDLFNRIADAGGRILIQPEYLMRYRIHPKSGTGTTANWDGTLTGWIRQCSVNRRDGKPEPTLAEFQQLRRSLPLLKRVDLKRRDTADIFYRRATFSYSIGNVGETALLVLASSILDPTLAPPQVWRKMFRPKLTSAISTMR